MFGKGFLTGPKIQSELLQRFNETKGFGSTQAPGTSETQGSFSVKFSSLLRIAADSHGGGLQGCGTSTKQVLEGPVSLTQPL